MKVNLIETLVKPESLEFIDKIIRLHVDFKRFGKILFKGRVFLRQKRRKINNIYKFYLPRISIFVGHFKMKMELVVEKEFFDFYQNSLV